MIERIAATRMPGSPELYDVWIGDDGRITAVAPAGEIAEQDGRSAKSAHTLHADGRVLTSGLWDEHVHLGQWALRDGRPDFASADSAEDALSLLSQTLSELLTARKLGASSRRHRSHQTELIGMRLRGGDWGGLTLAQLDGVSLDIPIVLLSPDLHGAWLNSAALRKHGFPVSHGAHVIEHECFDLLNRLDSVDDAELDIRINAGAQRAAAVGIVGVVDLEMRWSFNDWERREAAGFDALRVESAVYPERIDRAIAAGLRSGMAVGARGLVTVGPLKVITDGSLGTRTALCHAPYNDGGIGMQLVPPAELVDLMEHAHANGLTAAVHAIGDRANSDALSAFAATGARGRIEHAQLLRPADIRRFAELNVTASVQPAHILDDMRSMTQAWGERAEWAFPLASLLRTGARVVLGSDAPVAPLDPWLTVSAAVHRSAAGETPWTPEERLTVAQALSCSMRGSLRPRPGEVADLMLLDADPLANGPYDFRRPGVESTLVAGAPTHTAAALR